MIRVVLLLLLLIRTIAPSVECRKTLWMFWNPFADAANAYKDKLMEGMKDIKLQKKMMNRWKDLNDCGCF